MSRYPRIIIFSLLLSLPLSSLALTRTELLPPDAQTYVRISNTSNFWAKLKISPTGKLWVDPQFQDFMNNPDAETWQEFLLDGEADAETEMLLEQLKMLKGEAILAFDLSDEPFIIAAMSEADFIRSLDLDDKLREITDESFEIVKSTFQGVEIIQHIEGAGTPEEDISWQTHVDSTFVMGDRLEWVERCIVQLKKGEIDEPEGNPVLKLNLPLAQVIRASLSEDGTGTIENAMFEALGIMAMENLSVTLELKDNEMVVNNTLSISDLGRGLFTILDIQPSDLPTVAFIPENMASIEVGRFNLLRFWQEIPLFLTSTRPEMKMQFDLLLSMLQQQAGIDLEQDLLAHLGTKYVSFSVAEESRQISVVAIDLKDGMAFRRGLETALAAPAMQPYVATGLEISEFLDHTIYTLQENGPNDSMGICVSGDYLLYGDPVGLRQVIRSENSTATSTQAFEHTELVKGLRQNISSRAFAYSAIDWKKNMDFIIHELNNPEYTEIIQQYWAKSGSALPPPDFNKLPPADHIASFFNVSYQYIEANAEGLHQRIILKY